MKKSLTLITTLSLIVGSTATAKTTKDIPKIKHTLTLFNGYFEKTFNSNEGISHISLSILDAESKLFEYLEEKWAPKGRSQLFLTLGESILNGLLLANFVTPYHEFGHARAANSMGMDYKYGYYTDAKDDDLVDTVWGFYGRRLTNPSKWFSGAFCRYVDTEKYSEWRKKHLKDLTLEETTQWLNNESLYRSMAGLNNQTRAAKDISEKLYRNGALHHTYFLYYLGNKLSTGIYASVSDSKDLGDGDDIKSIARSYKTNDYNITSSDIKWGSVLSALLSGTTHAFVTQSLYRSVNNPQWSLTEKMTIVPLEFKGFRIPDLNFYFTLQGLSYELVTGYRFNENCTFDLAIEYVYKGGDGWQVTPGLHYTFNQNNPSVGTFDTFAGLVIGKGTQFGGEAGVTWTSPGGMFSIFGKYIYHNFNTLVGQRNIPDRTKGDIDHEVCFGISYNY